MLHSILISQEIANPYFHVKFMLLNFLRLPFSIPLEALRPMRISIYVVVLRIVKSRKTYYRFGFGYGNCPICERNTGFHFSHPMCSRWSLNGAFQFPGYVQGSTRWHMKWNLLMAGSAPSVGRSTYLVWRRCPCRGSAYFTSTVILDMALLPSNKYLLGWFVSNLISQLLMRIPKMGQWCFLSCCET